METFSALLALYVRIHTLIARFMGPTWGPSGDDRTQVGPIWPHEPCYLGGSLWIPLTKSQWCGALIFSLLSSWARCWTNSRVARGFGCHDAYETPLKCVCRIFYTVHEADRFTKNILVQQYFAFCEIVLNSMRGINNDMGDTKIHPHVDHLRFSYL